MQCREVRELADSFVTQQLLVETNHEVVRHLETCPACRAEIADLREMRERIRGAMMRAEALQPRREFAAELTARLRPGPHVISRRSLLQSWWSIAAGAVLAAGGGVALRNATSRSRLASVARMAEGDHQNCAVRFRLGERPVSLEHAGRQYGAPYAALATFEVPAADGSLEVLERHACVYQGRRFGHMVLRYQGALVSLLVTDGAAPAAPRLEPGDGKDAIAALPAGRFVAFVVADLDPAQLLRVAGMLAEPLSRHLG
jgi:anti-sigma factor RsiW